MKLLIIALLLALLVFNEAMILNTRLSTRPINRRIVCKRPIVAPHYYPQRGIATTLDNRPVEKSSVFLVLLGVAATGIGLFSIESQDRTVELSNPPLIYEYATNYEAIDDFIKQLELLPFKPYERFLLGILKQYCSKEEFDAYFMEAWKGRCQQAVNGSKIPLNMKLSILLQVNDPNIQSRGELSRKFHSSVINSYLELNHGKRIDLLNSTDTLSLHLYNLRLAELKHCLHSGVSKSEYLVVQEQESANMMEQLSSSWASIIEFYEDTVELRSHLKHEFDIREIL